MCMAMRLHPVWCRLGNVGTRVIWVLGCRAAWSGSHAALCRSEALLHMLVCCACAFTTQVTFRGDGPLGQLMTIADTKGNVKGKVRPARAEG